MLTNKNQNFYKFSFSLAQKDILHNYFSSVLIVLVIASICLPMLILTSLREGYVEIMKEMIDDTPQAKRVDVLLSDVTNDSLFFNSKNLAEYTKQSFIEAAIPDRTKAVLIETKKGQEKRFELVSTTPNDPDLKRYGFTGDLTEGEDLAIVLHQDNISNILGMDSIPERIELIIERGDESYSLDCKILGTVSGGEEKKIYGSINMLNKLEQWTLGYGVPAPYNLPAHINKEEAIGRFSVDTCLVISRFPLNDKQLRALSVQDFTAVPVKSKIVNEAMYYIAHKEKNKITDTQRGVIEDILSIDYAPIVLPVLKKLNVKSEGQPFYFASSITEDSRVPNLLVEGQWFDTYNSRFDVLIPDAVAKKGATFPYELVTKIGATSLTLNVVGTVKGEAGYMDYRTLYLLNLLKEGEVEVDAANERFQVKENINKELDKYLMARIHAKSLDDVIEVSSFFKKKGYEIYGSSQADIQAFKDMKRALTSFVLLITILGGIACIAALFVLMYEAIKRKKNQIGIMRAMGLTENFVTQIFIWQSLFYALSGFMISLFIYFFLRLTLDSSIGHTIVGIPNQDQSIFKLSFFTIILFIASVALVSYIAGRSAAQSIKNIHPADILADN